MHAVRSVVQGCELIQAYINASGERTQNLHPLHASYNTCCTICFAADAHRNGSDRLLSLRFCTREPKRLAEENVCDFLVVFRRTQSRGWLLWFGSTFITNCGKLTTFRKRCSLFFIDRTVCLPKRMHVLENAHL